MAISSLYQVDEYSRSEVTMALDPLHGESRGHWKYHVPDKKFRQAKAMGKIDNERATLLFDSGAEVSILNAAFARKVECYIDNNQKLECESDGKNPYMVEGRTRIKITLAGSLVYYFDVWVGQPTGGQNLTLSMDLMVPAGIRLDLADGSINLPDEGRIQLAGRRQLYGDKVTQVKLGEHCQLEVGESIEIRKGFILSNHRKLYAKWQNLAFQSTTDCVEVEERELAPAGPIVDRPQYDTPMKILRRDRETSRSVVAQLIVPRPAEMKPETEGPPRYQEVDTSDQDARESPPIEQATRSEMTADRKESLPRGETPPIVDPEPLDDEEVCYHEGGDLFAEDVERQMAILPEVVTTTDEVTIEDIQVGDPESNTPEEIDRLRQIIWRRKHLLIGKGNALPPAAVGAVCDIDVGGAPPVAQRVRLTRLMVYPMPLISDLLEDLDKVLWYCSLDMASGFWVVSMTERARRISAFITPFGLFEWTRMPFGLKNAPQIYQRLIDNALYGHFRICAGHDPSEPIDVFDSGEPEPQPRPSVLGRRSYIDDILVTAITWDMLCEKIEALLNACERWNLSISVVKSFWGRRKVDYLGHRVSVDGLEAHPKDLEMLGNLPFPQTLRSMQSFFGSLNYYSRFIEDFAVYAAVLYELREADFYEMVQQDRSITSKQVAGGVVTRAEDADRWARAKIAFTILKSKIVSTPVLKHFDPDRTPVIVVYASQWAISAALVQEHDGV
uniref:Reverse transcriptase domain-containing protein n=1 Tax=Phytophthora ramorum TaxID=164328 RepID=H3H288_PHYRM